MSSTTVVEEETILVEKSFIEKYRLLILWSPAWLAAIFVGLSYLSGDFRAVVQFMTSSPLR
ncbi:MAG TPA: hypothetical protein VGN17_17405 [Bryobacteraceae bacterium]